LIVHIFKLVITHCTPTPKTISTIDAGERNERIFLLYSFSQLKARKKHREKISDAHFVVLVFATSLLKEKKEDKW